MPTQSRTGSPTATPARGGAGSFTRPADIEKATNYVKVGLSEALADKPISAAKTRPYGCSIKYKSLA